MLLPPCSCSRRATSQVSSRICLCWTNRFDEYDGRSYASRERGLVRWDAFRHVSSYNPSVHAEFDVSRTGGFVRDPDFKRDAAPLLWMSYEAILAGLLMKPSDAEWKWNEPGDVHEFFPPFWRLLEVLPIKRLSYKGQQSLTFR